MAVAPAVRGAFGFGWAVANWLVTLTACLAMALSVLVPHLTGALPCTVETGSMTPTMPPGTLLLVRPVDPAQIATGTVITYQRIGSGVPEFVTHRVVTKGFDVTGHVVFRTRGDANDA